MSDTLLFQNAKSQTFFCDKDEKTIWNPNINFKHLKQNVFQFLIILYFFLDFKIKNEIIITFFYECHFEIWRQMKLANKLDRNLVMDYFTCCVTHRSIHKYVNYFTTEIRHRSPARQVTLLKRASLHRSGEWKFSWFYCNRKL